ncbi:zinc finger CCHC domain-containing protein 8-like isoform X3 [Macrobrachium nipponense]|uniref:zinc finger CCHC domain-containing protein 8-like isoform X3 n=1 Tax=Macrobrachium nipponense TaxID=159736 RepID=UPI0030C7DAED
MAENSDTENDSTVILDSSQDSSSVEIIEGAKKLAEISEVEKDSTVILESSLDSSGVEIIEEAKNAAYSSKGLEDSFSGADVDAIVVSSDSSGISIVKSDLHGIARNKDVVAVLNSSKKYTGGDETEKTAVVGKSQCSKENDNDEEQSNDLSKDNIETETPCENEDSGIYPASPFAEDDVLTPNTDDDKSLKMKDPSEKEDRGIFPANPFTDEDISTTDTGKNNNPLKTKDASEREDRGIFPANPFTDGDISTSDAGKNDNPLKTRDKPLLKRLNNPEIISSEEISSSDASTSQDSDKDKQSEMTSMKDMFFLDMDGEVIVNEENKDADVISFDGISLDVDGDAGTHVPEDNISPYPVHEIPKYYAGVAGVLSDIEYNMDTGKKIQDAKPKKTCFNCLGDHNFQECPEPSNPQRIAANRKKQKSSRISSMRYHEDCDNKYGQFQPGKISENLREALGLRYGELPIHIYRMRYLGYPPGWLKEAEVRQGEMKLYDGFGQSVLHPDAEEGELDHTLVKYNPDKLIGFPGFNVDIPKGYRDEWRVMNFMPMQRKHRISEFKRVMEMNKVSAYKKRKLKDEHLRGADTSVSSAEMEIDESGVTSSAEIEFNPPLPDEPLPPLPPEEKESPASPEMPEPVEEGEITEEDSQSSMSYLEAKRKSLLEQLGHSGNPSAESNQESNAEEKENVNSSDAESETESSTQLNEESENSRSSSNTNIHKKQKVKHHRSQSKGFKLGVAIPPSITPFTHLPSAEKWTVDVTDHINFENLPDALGTWEKMKGLVSKVRKRMGEIHVDEDE